MAIKHSLAKTVSLFWLELLQSFVLQAAFPTEGGVFVTSAEELKTSANIVTYLLGKYNGLIQGVGICGFEHLQMQRPAGG